jgi:hypothetical protein
VRHNYAGVTMNVESVGVTIGVGFFGGILIGYALMGDEELEDEIHKVLMRFVNNVVRQAKGRRGGVESLCENCGYDHRIRDFIRASLLRLIDGLEMTHRYIDFIRDKGIIDPKRYDEILELAQKAARPVVAEQTKQSFVQPDPFSQISEFLDKLPAKAYLFDEQVDIRRQIDFQEIVLNNVIKKYPEKINEIQHKMGGNFLSKNRFYTNNRGSKKISNNLWMGRKSPKKRMLKNCDKVLRLVGLNGLAALQFHK